MRKLRLIAILIIAILLLFPLTATPVYAQIAQPTSLVINSVECYRNVVETEDQLYLITGMVDYSGAPPSELISEAYLVRLMSDATPPVELGATTFYSYPSGGYDVQVMCSIYFAKNGEPTWGDPYTVQLEGNPTLSWAGGVPPHTEFSGINWIDEVILPASQARLTTRLRALALVLELDWGGTHDLIETIAGVGKLTDEGEEYFTNSIDNLRVMCPDLFSDVITTPDFPEKAFVEDYYMGGEDGDYDVYGANNIYAQTFTTTSGYSINGFEVRLFRVGTPGDITGSVRATAAGLPTGADLGGITGILDDDDVTADTSGDWYVISFDDDYELANNTQYAIVVSVPGGGVADYIGWWVNSAGTYATGQACFYNGAAWAAIPGEDFVFAIHATEAYTMSYRNRLANRLVGTRFDMTMLGEKLFGGLSRIWTSTIVWIIFACLMPTIFVCRAANSFKPSTMVFALMFPIGALAGFVYLEVAIILAFFCAAAGIYMLFYRGSAA